MPSKPSEPITSTPKKRTARDSSLAVSIRSITQRTGVSIGNLTLKNTPNYMHPTKSKKNNSNYEGDKVKQILHNEIIKL